MFFVQNYLKHVKQAIVLLLAFLQNLFIPVYYMDKKQTLQQVFKQEIVRLSQAEIKSAMTELLKQNKALSAELHLVNVRLRKVERALARANIELNPQPKEKKIVPPEKIRVSPDLLKKLMTRLQLNQATLARLLGVTPQTISHWMVGRVQPSKELKSKIAILRGKTAAQISRAVDTVMQKAEPVTSQDPEPVKQSE